MVVMLEDHPRLSKIDWKCHCCKKTKKVRVQTLCGIKAAGKSWRCASCARKDVLKSGDVNEFLGCRKGKSHSKAAIEKMSQSRKNGYEDGSIAVQHNSFRTKSYVVVHPVTEEAFTVQGTYELAYACHLVANGIQFISHPKPLPYFDKDGNSHLYFPDFYIPEFDVYIEIKSDYTLSMPGIKEKYENVKKMGHKLLILSNKQLKELKCLP